MTKPVEWRPIVGYEGLYEVSSDGQIRTIKTGHCRLRKLKVNPATGYQEIILYKNGLSKTYRVHRLVAKAFLGNGGDSMCINHKDENKLNNSVDNLEWCTQKYNNDYSAYRRFKRVLAYDIEGALLATFESEQIAACILGVSKAAVSSAVRGDRESCHGLVLRHEEK